MEKSRQWKVLSAFKFKQEQTKKKRKSSKKRYFEPETVTESDSFTDASSDSDGNSDQSEKLFTNVSYVKNATQTCDSCDLFKVERKGLKKESDRFQNLLRESIVRVRLLEEENSNLQNLVYNYQNLAKNGQLFKKTTELEKESFDKLFEFFDRKLKYYDNAKEIAQKTVSSNETPSIDTLQKRGPRPKVEAKNQLFMCLSWLKNGFTMSHVAWLFDTPTVSRYIITWINFMYFSLGSIPIWSSRQQIDEIMPESFKQLYPNTRCIIYCT